MIWSREDEADLRRKFISDPRPIDVCVCGYSRGDHGRGLVAYHPFCLSVHLTLAHREPGVRRSEP